MSCGEILTVHTFKQKWRRGKQGRETEAGQSENNYLHYRFSSSTLPFLQHNNTHAHVRTYKHARYYWCCLQPLVSCDLGKFPECQWGWFEGRGKIVSPTVCVHWQGCETRNKLVMFQENYQRQRRDQRREVFEINEIMTRRWPGGGEDDHCSYKTLWAQAEQTA